MKDTDVRTPLERLRRTFDSGKTRPLAWRKQQLKAIEEMLRKEEPRILEALHKDLGRCAFEGYGADIALTSGDLRNTRRNLDYWLEPEPVPTSLFSQPGRSMIVREPLGVVLVIGPWNYPLQLVVEIAGAALAAGNCVVMKPSELSANTSALLAEIIPKYLDPDAVALVQGGIPETTALLEQKFDHICYTGNGTVAKVVMTAAAQHLTPVTLELGGKSPTIVDADVDVFKAARRIAHGKWGNAGQTCVAPDYVLVHKSHHDALVAALKEHVRAFYGDNPKSSDSFGRIINERHVGRLQKLLGHGKVAFGGEVDVASRYIAPTVMTDVDLQSPLMTDEIFGPILPIIPIDSVDDAISFIRARPKPLALYVFSKNSRVIERFEQETSSGGFVSNDVWMHAFVPDLPFGGVGPSGMGAYHGKIGIDNFSHKKAVLHRSRFLDPSIRFPPYTGGKLKWLKRLMSL